MKIPAAEIVSTNSNAGNLPAFGAVDRESGSVLEAIVAQVSAALASGIYAPGDSLPGERDLAAQFQVSRNTLREALSTLNLLGVIEVHHGARTRIAADGASALVRGFDFLVQLDRPDYTQIQRARESVEVQLAGEAAARATSADIAAIECALNSLIRLSSASPYDRDDVRAANYAFHRTVAAAAHNLILERVLVQLHHARMELVLSGPTRRPDRPETNEVHERIFYAIRDHDMEEARRAMTMDMGIAMRVLHKLYANRNDAGKTPGIRAASPQGTIR